MDCIPKNCTAEDGDFMTRLIDDEKAIEIANSEGYTVSRKGGARPGAGRPKGSDKKMVSIRMTPEEKIAVKKFLKELRTANKAKAVEIEPIVQQETSVDVLEAIDGETSFAERIKMLRKQYNLTLVEFAQIHQNTSKSTAGAWEQNTQLPSYEVLLRIAEMFSVSLDWLCGNSNNQYNKELILKNEKRLDYASIPNEIKETYENNLEHFSWVERAEFIFFIQAAMVNADKYLSLLKTKLSEKDLL